MLTIEEVKAARPSSQYTIPAGAKHEFGEVALKRQIEDHVSEQDSGAVATLRTAVSKLWQKITGSLVPKSSTRRIVE